MTKNVSINYTIITIRSTFFYFTVSFFFKVCIKDITLYTLQLTFQNIIVTFYSLKYALFGWHQLCGRFLLSGKGEYS